eukprot:TRINITY_DN23475_c0_g1_i3.p2 TRINITY_DN23475_c0_g1~~TRINITY_DN23475_c0_g1_i3.p2  ORF type:complete len:107 (+),score=6.42 TRINITY_DN23475_c0_g1_i3:213-533(+)
MGIMDCYEHDKMQKNICISSQLQTMNKPPAAPIIRPDQFPKKNIPLLELPSCAYENYSLIPSTLVLRDDAAKLNQQSFLLQLPTKSKIQAITSKKKLLIAFKTKSN